MKKLLILLLAFSLLVYTPYISGQAGEQGAEAIETSGPGMINWSNGWIYATGIAAPNPKFSLAQQRAGLVLGARKDAQRKLLETVKGVTITSETVVQDFITVSDIIKTSVRGMIVGAIMIGQPVFKPDGSCEVTMAMPIYPNLTQAIMADPQVRKKVEPPPAPRQTYNYTPNTPTPPPPPPPPVNPPPPPVNPPPVNPPPPPPPPPSATESFPAGKSKWDGLVIDGRQSGLKPALLPVVYNEAGTVVYSQTHVNDQTTIKAGIVGYARDLDAAKRHFRVAEEPLVIIARGARGTKKTDPVISNQAAQYIQQTEPSSGYLRNGRVMVVF